MAWIRFGLFAMTTLFVYLLWQQGWPYIALTIIGGLAALLAAVAADANVQLRIDNTRRLIHLTERELQVLEGNTANLETGMEFYEATHAYANDLDIFGPHSLYQYINRCTSQQGKALLAQYLLQGRPIKAITQQQATSKALQQYMDWMLQYQAYGHEHAVTTAMQQRINEWASNQQPVFKHSIWRWLLPAYTLLTLCTAGLYVLGFIHTGTFSIALLLFFLFATVQSKKVHTTYLLLTRMVKQVATLQSQLQWFEQANFNTSPLQALQVQLRNNQTHTAAHAIAQLKKILDRFDVRLNVFVFYFLNTFLLWDVRQMLALQKWKQQHAPGINNWFQTLASVDVSVSIATLAFNRPQWCYPVITNNHFELQAINIGHPLLPVHKRVDNSLGLTGTGQVALITGSNMGGKSTFLRSLGVNAVLALMGSPVCATAFQLSHVRLMSSMRIADNLAESTSTFYAELKKLQSIITAVNNKEHVLILLDEILRGTNSLDRHTGSKALIRQLIQQQAVAIIATHDVELAALQNNYPQQLHNYHFDVQVTGEELYFDYLLKQGVCQSLNASLLMKKIGINL